MPANAEDAVGQRDTSTLAGLKEGGNSSHLEAVTCLSDDDQAFLDSFTAEQRKKVLWKVGFYHAPQHRNRPTNGCYS